MATRRERVILELEDQFSAGMLRAAAAAKAADKAFDSVGDSSVRSSDGIDKTGTSSRRTSKDIDRLSGRLGLLRDVSLTLGPALVPIGAMAIPAVAGLAAQFGAAALAAGTSVVAFQGVGEALEAVQKAALEPTTQNLEEARVALQALAPEARNFVLQLQEMRPAFETLRNAAAAGLFPGLTEALGQAEGSFDRMETVLYRVGEAAGSLAEDFAEGLAGPRGQEFLDFIAAEVPSALEDLGHTVGNLAAGMGELWMAFTPLNRSTANWLLDASESFDRWASGLADTQGFRDFVDYIRTSGPQVADALGALGNAFVQLVTAAAPMGGPTLAAIEAVADLLSMIAESPAGPALVALASGLALTNRALKAMDSLRASNIFQNITAGADGSTKSLSRMERVATGAVAALAGLAVVDALQGGLKDYSLGVEGVTKSILDMNAATSADLPANLEGLADSIDRLANPGRAEALQDSISNALGGIGNEEEYDRAVGQIEAIEAALVGLVSTGNAAAAEEWLAGLNLTDQQRADLLSLMPEFRDALVGVENQARLAGDELEDGFDRATGAAQRFRDAVAAANRALDRRSTMRDYEQAIDDLTKSVKENGKSLDITTQKGRNNQAALDGIASAALGVAENMKGTNRVAFLKAARADIVDAAEKLGMTKREAQELADKLLGLDQIKAQPTITVNDNAALSAIAGVAAGLTNLNGRTATTYIKTVKIGPAAGVAVGLGATRRAAGGAIYGPGTGTSDSVPAWLSNGEHVWTAREVANAGGHAAMEALRAQFRYAQGGAVADRGMSRAPAISVGAPSVSVGGPQVRVFIDGAEVRAVVRSEQAADRRFVGRLADRD